MNTDEYQHMIGSEYQTKHVKTVSNMIEPYNIDYNKKKKILILNKEKKSSNTHGSNTHMHHQSTPIYNIVPAHNEHQAIDNDNNLDNKIMESQRANLDTPHQKIEIAKPSFWNKVRYELLPQITESRK